MALIEYNIKASSIGTSYPTGTLFLFYTSIEDCGIGIPVNVTPNVYGTPTSNSPVTIAEFIAGVRVAVDSSIQYLYVYPVYPAGTREQDIECKLGCAEPSHRIELSGYIPLSPSPSLTPSPSATPSITPSISPTPSSSPPQTGPTYNWSSFGIWTLAAVSSTTFRFTSTDIYSVNPSNLANYLSSGGIYQGSPSIINSGVKVYPENQPTGATDPPSTSVILDISSYVLGAQSQIVYTSSPYTRVIELINMDTIPSNFPTSTQTFRFLDTIT